MAMADIPLSFLAALFAYLSWKRATLESPYELEDTLRNRLRDSSNVTNFYTYDLGRVQVSEYEGWEYGLSKYLPYVGQIRGKTLVYLYFSSLDYESSAVLPPVEEIRNHPDFNGMPISNIAWGDELSSRPEGDKNLEIIFETVDPDVLLKTITDLSGIMIELNRESDDEE